MSTENRISPDTTLNICGYYPATFATTGDVISASSQNNLAPILQDLIVEIRELRKQIEINNKTRIRPDGRKPVIE